MGVWGGGILSVNEGGHILGYIVHKRKIWILEVKKKKKRKYPIENKAYFYYFLCSSDSNNIVMKMRKKALIFLSKYLFFLDFTVLKQIPSTGWPFRANV